MKDALYEKYRVFREPKNSPEHPAEIVAYWVNPNTEDGYEYPVLSEVREFVFVLKPDTDKHALLALKVYAELVAGDYPKLAEDLRIALSAY